ncbi:MAG: collagen-binding domain-containing protein, partial [Vagococcus sp.]
MKRDSIKKGIWLLLMVVVVVQSIVFGARFVQASEVEHRISNNLNDYNVFLTGYHSADSADIEGPLAVKKDSSFGKNLETYSYAAMFAENANTVGTPLDFGTQKTSLLIGGKIKNYSTSVQPVIESRTYEAEKIGWLGSSHADNTSYFEKVNVTDAQKKLISEDFNKKTFFLNCNIKLATLVKISKY